VLRPGRPDAADRVADMLRAIRHRGPDDEGLEVVPDVGLALGHQRLSIIDLSALGHQPMRSQCGRNWLVFNGEIYNFSEIRAELGKAGHRFGGHSDTEVILAAYAQWGLDAVSRFRGMFAFALWDGLQRRLHLCRDRFGVKPLYFTVFDGQLAFASEVKALLALPATSRHVDPIALSDYLQFGYASAPRSMFSAIRVVRPGTILTVDLQINATERVYWSLGDLFDKRRNGALRAELRGLSATALLDRMEDELGTAFAYRLVADVPVGLFLSGGVDSSLVAGLLAKRASGKLRTFTIGYGGSEFDETAYARAVAEHVGSDHMEFIVTEQEALALSERVVDIADEPIGDSSMIPTLMVCQLARQHVKVALSADGADELFAGYARYGVCGRYASRLGSPLRSLQWLSAEIIDCLPRSWLAYVYGAVRGRGNRFAAIEDKVRKFVNMSRARSVFAAYEATVSEWTSDQRIALGRRPEDTDGAARALFEGIEVDNPREAFLHFDAARYLPGDLLTKVDRASMAVSLEAREPFLDHEMAKVAAALPFEWKVRNGREKYLLRKLLDRHFPSGLFDRPKHGFSAPIAAWLHGPLRDRLGQELSADAVRRCGMLDPVAVRRSLDDFNSTGRNTSAAGIWFLFQLQRWGRRWGAQPPG
jgi:asparagine synthase (glutamine-hydrolysing)